MNPRAALKGLALILSLALIGWLFNATGLADAANESWVDAHIRGQGLAGYALFVGVGSVLTAVGMPRQVVAFLAGYAFGVFEGTLIGATAALGGCILTFYYARLFGRGLLQARLGKRAARFDAFITRHPFGATLLIRLLPAGSNLLTNLVAGVSSVPGRYFFGASWLGYVPQTLVFALVGSGVQIAPAAKTALAAGLFIVSGVIGVSLYRRVRHDDRNPLDIASDGPDTLPAPDARNS